MAKEGLGCTNSKKRQPGCEHGHLFQVEPTNLKTDMLVRKYGCKNTWFLIPCLHKVLRFIEQLHAEQERFLGYGVMAGTGGSDPPGACSNRAVPTGRHNGHCMQKGGSLQSYINGFNSHIVLSSTARNRA